MECVVSMVILCSPLSLTASYIAIHRLIQSGVQETTIEPVMPRKARIWGFVSVISGVVLIISSPAIVIILYIILGDIF